jgi:aminopeptidase YwaD
MHRYSRLSLRAAASAAILLVPGAAAPAQRVPVPAFDRYFTQVRAQFSGDRARDVVAFMDRSFRVPGNTGFNASIDHVIGILRAAGYVREDSAPASARLVYRVEERPIRGLAWDPLDAAVQIVGEREPLLRFATNRNMLAINSYSTPDTGIVAELVYAKGGTGPVRDVVDMKGKIVIDDAAVGTVLTQGLQRGALGAMGYRIPAYNKPDTHPNAIPFTSITLDTVRKPFGIALSKRAHDALMAALARGPVKLRVTVRTRLFPSTERTLVAEVRGSERAEQRFVFSAHVQEPGANDNASGVGALSEMARVLAVLSKAGTVVPRRTITMLFGNEIAQTRNFLAADSARTRNVLWGLSMDMVGEDTDKTGGTFLIEKMPDPSAVWTRGEEKHSEWGGQPLAKSRIVPNFYNDFLLNRCLDQAATNGWVVKTNPFEGGSDHTPFLDAKKPGVLFWHFTDVNYHTDGDRLEMVSAKTLTNTGVSALVSALILTTADAGMTRSIVDELERAAVKRLDTELALSRAALAAPGGDAAKERDILETWTDFYVRSFETIADVEVNGATLPTGAAITAAQGRVRAAGTARLASLGR